MNQLTTRLGQLRGPSEPEKLSARTIVALTNNPGCQLRTILDAAGINKQALAAASGYPNARGQSELALARGKGFESKVKANGCAELLTLLRRDLGFTVPEVAYDDLESVGGNTSNEARYLYARQMIERAAAAGDDAGCLFDHPMLRLETDAGLVYLEPDVVAFKLSGKFYIIEVKSMAVIDGQAPGASVRDAMTQSALYVVALREMLTLLKFRPDMVANDVVLVCRRDFSSDPVATLVNIRPRLGVVERQLQRLRSLDRVLELLPDGAVLSDSEPEGSIRATLRAIGARYMPECLSNCEMARFCREEARGSTAALGAEVREALGGIESIEMVIGLADGSRPVSPDHAEHAEVLRQALAYRRELLGARA